MYADFEHICDFFYIEEFNIDHTHIYRGCGFQHL